MFAGKPKEKRKAKKGSKTKPTSPFYDQRNGGFAHIIATTTITNPPSLLQRADLAYQNTFAQPDWNVSRSPINHLSNSCSTVTGEASSDNIIDGSLSQLISSKLDSVINAIDEEAFTGDERDLTIQDESSPSLRGGGSFSKKDSAFKRTDRAISSTLVHTNYFAKANLYANSRLPPNLPPLQLYLPAYTLLCLAAQYSQRAYAKPSSCDEQRSFVNADWRMGTKAMMIKSVPMDHMNCIIFAIRGTQTFFDWAVNLKSVPISPAEFLNDAGNLCHSGFLSVAKSMIAPVAARLRSLLEGNPNRSSCSLLITGHSAGGAVASLLYAHMLAENVRSELNILTGCFKRIHCITFGTPPISLLPLTKPTSLRYKKNLFMSFINEGDPVPRADPAYVRSLLRLYASPSPGSGCALPLTGVKPCKRLAIRKRINSAPANTLKDFLWEVPPGTLSNAGRLVVLRGTARAEMAVGEEDNVKAEITCDQELRGVVFGDPIMHMMKIYARRVEVLATRAVTGRMWNI